MLTRIVSQDKDLKVSLDLKKIDAYHLKNADRDDQ